MAQSKQSPPSPPSHFLEDGAKQSPPSAKLLKNKEY
jgi:hypothetical protein